MRFLLQKPYDLFLGLHYACTLLDFNHFNHCHMYIDGSTVENQSVIGCDTLLVISTKDFSTREKLLNNVREIILKQEFVTKMKNRKQIVTL